MPGKFLAQISREALQPSSLAGALEDLSCGAVCVFEGRVRDHHCGREVARLEYECYQEMAVEVLESLCREALQRWPLGAVVAVHRVGRLQLGETAVWIGVASPHRDEAFQACRFMIEAVKERLPVWKKEIYSDGTTDWVGLGPGRKAPVG